MSQNPERESFADALHDAAAVFKAPDTASLYGAAVRRGRQIRRRRAGAVAGGTTALGMAGVLVFALSVGTGHGAGVAAASRGASATASPAYTHPASPPVIRSGAITGTVMDDSVYYALPSTVRPVTDMTGSFGSANVEVVDTGTHSWYVQTAEVLQSKGQVGTSVAVSVEHTAGSDSCTSLNQGIGGGKGTCTRSTLDGGKLLDEVVPLGVVSNENVLEIFEWDSPAGYETDVQLDDNSVDDFALTKAQAEAVLTNQVFGTLAHALPADACVGGSFSKPVDPPKPGQSPLQHVRCSTDHKLYPSY